MNTQICQNCGAEISTGTNFCIYCGASTASDNAKTTHDEQPVTVEVPSEAPQQAPAAQPTQDAPMPAHETEHDPTDTAVATEEPVPTQDNTSRPKIKKRRGIGATLLAILWCVILFIGSVALVALVGTNQALSEDSFSTIADELLSNIDDIPISDFSKELPVGSTAVDLILAMTEKEGTTLNRRDLKQFLAHEDVVDFIAKTLSTYVNDIKNNSKKAMIDESAFRDFIEDCRETLADELNVYIGYSEIDKIVETTVEAGILDYTNAKELKKSAPEVYMVLHYVLSDWMVWAIGGLMVLMAILLMMANRWSIIRISGDLGTTLTVSGALTALCFALSPILIGKVIPGLPVPELFSTVLSCVITPFMLTALCVLGCGIFLIIVNAIAKAILKAYNRKLAK